MTKKNRELSKRFCVWVKSGELLLWYAGAHNWNPDPKHAELYTLRGARRIVDREDADACNSNITACGYMSLDTMKAQGFIHLEHTLTNNKE